MKIPEERIEAIKKLSKEPDVYERLSAALGKGSFKIEMSTTV